MNNFKKYSYLFAGVAFFAFSGLAMASPMGTISFTNCTPDGGATVTATTITWLPDLGGGRGCIATGLPTSVTYSGGTFTSGTGSIEDLPAGPPPFMLFAGGVLSFGFGSFSTPVATDGVCSTTVTLASGHSCIIFAGSPFLLTSDGTTTTVTLDIMGIVTDTGAPIGSNTSQYAALFTTQSNFSTDQIAANINSGGSQQNTYSATLIITPPVGQPTVPEPATATLAGLGIGLVVIGYGRKRFETR